MCLLRVFVLYCPMLCAGELVENERTDRDRIFNRQVMRRTLIQQQPSGRREVLIREPDLQPYEIARREIEPRTEIRIGRQDLCAERSASPLQFLWRQDAEVAPDDQLRVAVKTASAHQTVLVLRKCNRPTGQRRTVRQIQIVQQRQRMPLRERRLNRAVRQPDGHGLSERFQ